MFKMHNIKHLYMFIPKGINTWHLVNIPLDEYGIMSCRFQLKHWNENSSKQD